MILHPLPQSLLCADESILQLLPTGFALGGENLDPRHPYHPRHVQRIHDTVQPPLTRLCVSEILPEEQTHWQAQRQVLNPRTLRTQIYQALEHLETLAYPERWPEARATLRDTEEKDSLEGKRNL